MVIDAVGRQYEMIKSSESLGMELDMRQRVLLFWAIDFRSIEMEINVRDDVGFL